MGDWEMTAADITITYGLRMFEGSKMNERFIDAAQERIGLESGCERRQLRMDTLTM